MLKRPQHENQSVMDASSQITVVESVMILPNRPLPNIATASSSAIATVFPTTDDFLMWQELREHYHELLDLRAKGLVTEEDMVEILKQHQLFLERSGELIAFHGKVAVMCAGEFFIADNLNDAVAKAHTKYQNKPYYAETIDLSEFS